MKRFKAYLILLIFLLLSIMQDAFSQADAGPDKVMCKECDAGVTIGGFSDPSWCYTWSPSSGIVNNEIHNPHPVVKPTTTQVYTVKVVGPDFTFTSQDIVTVTVVEIDKIQYKLNNVWTDVPGGGFNVICPNSSITFKVIMKPDNPVIDGNNIEWGGDASGTGLEKTVTFNSTGNRSVTVKCCTDASTKTIAVAVGNVNSTVPVTWDPETYIQTGTGENSSTVEKNFVVEYNACGDINMNKWNMRVKKITGGVTITVDTIGYRNPFTNPPTTEIEAKDAVNDMNGYYARGRTGNWHTETASKAHEQYHYSEWKCSSEHYWNATEICIENLNINYQLFNTENDAINAMLATASLYVSNFKTKARQYMGTLGDDGSDRPYAAGQLALNAAVESVQTLAARNGWITVSLVVNTPSTANPCYKMYLPDNPCP